MTVDAAEVYLEMLAEVAKLGRQMIYLEQAAASAYDKNLWSVVGDLHEQRHEVQASRSELMRQVWAHRRRRRLQGFVG